MNISQKEEFRYQYAGMAMQAIILAVELSNNYNPKNDHRFKHELSGYALDLCEEEVMGEDAVEFIQDGIAKVAVLAADALIAELDRKDKP